MKYNTDSVQSGSATAEAARMRQNGTGAASWKYWGPYLSERQWGTVREDYSPDGNAWEYLPRSRSKPRVPVGRGWHSRHLGYRPIPVHRARAVERARPDSERAPVWADEFRG